MPLPRASYSHASIANHKPIKRSQKRPVFRSWTCSAHKQIIFRCSQIRNVRSWRGGCFALWHVFDLFLFHQLTACVFLFPHCLLRQCTQRKWTRFCVETPLRPEGSPAASSVPSKRSVLLVPGQVSSDTQSASVGEPWRPPQRGTERWVRNCAHVLKVVDPGCTVQGTFSEAALENHLRSHDSLRSPGSSPRLTLGHSQERQTHAFYQDGLSCSQRLQGFSVNLLPR